MTVFKESIRHDTTCRICGSRNIKPVFQLNPTPPEDQFVPEEKLNIVQDAYPLVLALCENCGYLYLPFILNPEISYSHYLYETKITIGLTKQYQEYADQIISMTGARNGDLVVDLGSNDGTMLESFKRRGMKVLGVEPSASIAQVANEKGIHTIIDFFTDCVVDKIINEFGHAEIITANYMYANIDDLHEFTNNVSRLLSKEGVFVVQTGYHPEQMKINMFDYIYHEHFSYFTLNVLKNLFAKHGLDLIDAQKYPAKGGSLRVIAQRVNGKRPVAPDVNKILAEEKDNMMHRPEPYLTFAIKVEGLKKQLSGLINQIEKDKKRVVGYGASHSTTTLTYHFDLGTQMEYLVDDNPLKQGMYSPGNHIIVHPSQYLFDDKPDYAIILAWQYQSQIIAKNQLYLKQGGKFIVPLPELKVIEKENRG